MRRFRVVRRLGGAATVLAAAGIAAVAACYPGDVTNVGELDLVVTVKDDTVNFRANSTYFLLDSVFHVRDTANPADTISISRAFDQQILNLVRTNMNSLGYTLVSNATPDVIVGVSINATRVYQAYSSYPWYGYPGYPWWPPVCCGPGWGWPGGVVVTSYRAGSVFLTMIDTDKSVAADSVVVIWEGTINGPFEGSSADAQARLDRTINQAFEQSPYLATGSIPSPVRIDDTVEGSR